MKKKYIIGIVLITILIIVTIIFKNNCKKEDRSIVYENTKLREEIVEKFEKEKNLPKKFDQNENAGGVYVKIKNNNILLEKTNLDTSIRVQEILTNFFTVLNDTDKKEYKDELKAYGVTKEDYNKIFKEFDKNNRVSEVIITSVDNNKDMAIQMLVNNKVSLTLEIKNNFHYKWSRE